MTSALQRLRDQKVRGAAIVGEQHGELEADLSISDLRHASTTVMCRHLPAVAHFCSAAPSRVIHSVAQALRTGPHKDSWVEAERGLCSAGRSSISISGSSPSLRQSSWRSHTERVMQGTLPSAA